MSVAWLASHFYAISLSFPLVSCLGGCDSNELSVREVSNEELCVIVVDKGLVSDHLPNEVFEALRLCKTQLIDRHGYSTVEVQRLRQKNVQQRKLDQKAIAESLRSHQFIFPKLAETPPGSEGEPSFPKPGASLTCDEAGLETAEEDIWRIKEDNPYYISLDPRLGGDEEDSDNEERPPATVPSLAQRARRWRPKAGVIGSTPLRQPASRRQQQHRGQRLEVVAEVETGEEVAEEEEEEPGVGRGLPPHLSQGNGMDRPAGNASDTATDLDGPAASNSGVVPEASEVTGMLDSRLCSEGQVHEPPGRDSRQQQQQQQQREWTLCYVDVITTPPERPIELAVSSGGVNGSTRSLDCHGDALLNGTGLKLNLEPTATGESNV